MRALGYAEIAIVVEDVDRATRFYVDVVGFEPTDVDAGEGARILKVGPDSFLGLWAPGRWRSDYLGGSYGDYFGRRVGQAHIVFAVHEEDVPDLAQRLTGAGHEVAGPMPHTDGSPHLYVSDPDGHAIEFWGRRR